MSTNGMGVQDTQGSNSPNDSLAVAYEIIKPTTDDEFIAEFGKGNYTTAELYKQLGRFPQTMYEAAAWDGLEERAFLEARQEIAEEGLVVWERTGDGDVAKRTYAAYDDLDGEVAGEYGSADAYGEKVLQEHPKGRRFELVQDLTGYAVGERGPNARTMEMVNEASRAKDGKLLDNTTSDVHEYRGEAAPQGRKRR